MAVSRIGAMRRLRLWLVLVPLAVAGTQAGTVLLDTFAGKSYEGAELFSRGSASAVLLPPVVACAAALLLGALLSIVRAPTAGRALPLWAFACLPLVLFAVQEHVEWALGHHDVPLVLVVHPMFAVGIAIQLPFAALSYAVARLLVGAAAAIGARRSRRPTPARRPFRALLPVGEASLRTLFSGSRASTRGPPVPISL
jgi:hypothetical protein